MLQLDFLLSRRKQRDYGRSVGLERLHAYRPPFSGPAVGAVAVMARRGGGHVGVVSGVLPNGDVKVISGNHGHTVLAAACGAGLTPMMRHDGFFYCVGGRTDVAISRAAEEHRGEKFVQKRVGLHHVCSERASARMSMNSTCYCSKWARKSCIRRRTGHGRRAIYSVLFEDPS